MNGLNIYCSHHYYEKRGQQIGVVYDGKGDPVKYLTNFKTDMSLRDSSPVVKYRAFYLTLRGTVEVWYTKIPERCIRSLPDVKKVFLKCFTNKMNTYEQVTNRKVLYALREGLDINSLFWSDVQNKDTTSYNALLEMIRQKLSMRN